MTENTLINNRYELIKPLGQGGQGDVYLCLDHRLDRKCACKVVNQRGKEEIAALKAVSSPSFPRIIDVHDACDKTYIFMDYCEGTPLRDVLKRRSFSEKEIIAYGLAICDCIRQLHESTPPMLYLDCKPGNIMLTSRGEIRLVDLGSALTIDKIKGSSISGTPWYSSPEQRSGGVPDIRSDIYSIGKTLYYMACRSKVEYRNPKGELDLRSGNPTISARLSRAIARSCADSADKRYQSIDELMSSLEAARRSRYEINISHVIKNIADVIVKLSFSVFILLSAGSYTASGQSEHLCLCISLLGALILMCNRRKASVITHIEDIFMGVGKRMLLVIALTCSAVIFVKRVNGQLANPQVTIVDSSGYYCLYKGQSVHTEGDDIVLRIPISSLEYGTVPCKFIVE